MISTPDRSMQMLKNTITKDPFIDYRDLDNNCITIYPMSMASKRAAYSLKQIKNSIINGELKGLVLKDIFKRDNLNSLTVCVDEDRNHTYDGLIYEIEG